MFKFKDLTPEEKERRGILGRLYGPCASISIPTRNGRFYSESLWNKVFDTSTDSLTMEMFKNGGIPMELDHPTDREETCSDRIAAMLPEPPTKDKDGHLVCCVDIIDTPCGRIAYQLAKYGFNLGISSRGSGEVVENYKGEEEVDANSYNFQTFDLVLLPSVKDARLKLMTESLNGKTFKQALNEEIEKATPEEKKIMEESLKELNIGYKDSKESNNIDKLAAKDTGADLIKTLQESLLAKEKADSKITELQEKLSVCYAKEVKYEEVIGNYKNTISNLNESIKSLKSLQDKVKFLTNELGKKDTLIQENKIKLESLEKDAKNSLNKTDILNENLSNTESELRRATNKVGILTEKLKMANSSFEKERQSLTESYENLKKDYNLKQAEYSTKLSKANSLVEQYRGTAKKAVDKYIESKAISLGINSNEVRNKLPENYSFKDIDNICEELSDYALQINSLPFDVRSIKKVSITESRKLPRTALDNNLEDGDEVDDNLIRLARNLSQQK